MKHTFKITLILVFLFFIAQIVGLTVINGYIDHEASAEKGETVTVDLPYGFERPPVEEGGSFIFILVAILIGTMLVMLLIKFKRTFLWKIWFFLAIVMTLSISFSAFINRYVALALGLILAGYKIFKPNVIIHNFTEVFVYGGLAAIFVPVMNLFAVVALLILISIYDFIAVFKIKHMVTMAKFQTEAKVFAGLLIPYERKKKGKKITKGIKVEKKVRTAILGGGDIGFPLIFAGVVMKGLMLTNSLAIGFLKTLIIPLFVSGALLLLFVKGKKDKFYPAMPFLTVGCFVGYGVLLLVNLL